MIEIEWADKSVGGIVGLFIGLFLGAIGMFYKIYKNDEAIEENAKDIARIKERFMPRAEIIQLHKESQSEIKELHKDMSSKLDTINTTLVQIRVALAEKADRE